MEELSEKEMKWKKEGDREKEKKNIKDFLPERKK